MQEKSERNLKFFSRVERLMLKQGITWKKACSVIGISTTMLHYIKTGQNEVSNKVMYRLEEAERQAGLVPARPGFRETMSNATILAEHAGGSLHDQQATFEPKAIQLSEPLNRLLKLEGHLAGLTDAVDSLKSALVTVEVEIGEMKKLLRA